MSREKHIPRSSLQNPSRWFWGLLVCQLLLWHIHSQDLGDLHFETESFASVLRVSCRFISFRALTDFRAFASSPLSPSPPWAFASSLISYLVIWVKPSLWRAADITVEEQDKGSCQQKGIEVEEYYNLILLLPGFHLLVLSYSWIAHDNYMSKHVVLF